MTDPIVQTTRLALSPETREEDFLQDDILAVEACQSPEQFEQLYLRNVQSVYRYLYSRLGNQTDAEDVTAETFLAALRNIASYRQKGHFRAWLFSIARNKAMDFFRRNHPVEVLDEDSRIPLETDVLQDVIHNQRRSVLAGLIADLPMSDQELLRLRFTAGMTFSEMSHLLHRSEGSVKKSIYRLLARLERQMEDYHD